MLLAIGGSLLIAPFWGASWAAALVGLGVLIGSGVGFYTADRPLGKHRGRPGLFQIEGERLCIIKQNRRHDVSIDEVDDGWLEDCGWMGQADTLLVLRLRNGIEFVAQLPDEQIDAARDIMRAVGADTRAVRLKLIPTTRGWRVATGCMLVPVAALAGLFLIIAGNTRPLEEPLLVITFSFVALFLVGLVAAFRVHAAQIDVGSDGVLVRRPLRRRRFIPHAHLQSVEVVYRQLRLDDGTAPIALQAQSQAAAQAAESCIVAAGKVDEQQWVDTLERLKRGDRGWQRWRASLATLLGEEGSYRRGHLALRDLLRVVESPSGDPEIRIGAALALAGRTDKDLERRLRIASEACAEPALRMALRAASEGELEVAALEEAIALHAGGAG